MCDYSLHLVKSRHASVADKLVTTKFANSITRGFAAVGEPEVAVCLRPGTEIAFEHDVEFQESMRSPSRRTVKQRTARFRQVNSGDPHAHHHALEFSDGQIVLLTNLREGQHATVLQLPATEKTVAVQEHCEAAPRARWWAD
jgi:hypothetical protein